MHELNNNDYDRVAYPSLAHSQTFAEFLAIKGRLRGMAVAPPDQARILELGCGDGFNLAVMAVRFPGAQYTGIDYATEAVARGRRMLADLDLRQVRLEAADIRQLDGLRLPEHGFDYIIAHGVYSWVPADVREALLAVIDRCLAPQGVAFVSYQALPGSFQREATRTIMRYHTRSEENPQMRATQARAILRVIAKGARQDNHYTRWIADELELIERRPDEGLFHDELSDISAPVLFTEFLAHAVRHDLHFLSESEYLVPVSAGLTEEAKASLKPLESNRVLLEQYLDFMEGRRFRQTLLCRPGMGADLEPGGLDSLWVTCAAKPSTPVESIRSAEAVVFGGTKETKVNTSDPLEKAIMLAMTESPGEPRLFPDVLAATRARLTAEGVPIEADFEVRVRRFVCKAWIPGLATLYWQPPAHSTIVTARPFAHPIARWQARQSFNSVINYHGKNVEVGSELGRYLLTLLDGTRDHVALAGAVRDYLVARHETARARGETVGLPSPDDPELASQVLRGLAGLAAMSLFRRD